MSTVDVTTDFAQVTSVGTRSLYEPRTVGFQLTTPAAQFTDGAPP